MAKRFFKGLWDYIKRADIILWLLLAMISAYSLVLLRVKDEADAQAVADAVLENVQMNKWVCVMADKARVATFGDKVLFVMSNTELTDADALMDAAPEALGVTFAYENAKDADTGDGASVIPY